MHDVLLQIKEYLAMRDIRFAEQSEDCLMVPIQGQACSFQVRVSIDDDTPDQVTLAAWASVIVPVGARRSVAETACRVNAGLRMGRCELDFDAGYMGFFVSQYVAEELQGERLDHLFQLTAWTLDLYVAAALSVVYGNEPPADAVRAAKIAAGVLSVDDEDEASDDRDESPHD